MAKKKTKSKKKAVKKKEVRKKTAAKKKAAPKKKTAKPVKKKASAGKSSVKKSKSSAKPKAKTKAKVKAKKAAAKKVKKASPKKAVAKKAAPKKAAPKKAVRKKAALPKAEITEDLLPPEEQEVKIKKKPGPLSPMEVKIRDRLLQNRAEVLNMLASSQAMERDVEGLTFSNEIDLASSLEGREMIFQLSSRDRNELKMIDAALIKMKEGTYGFCETCGKKISIKRLQILPLTAMCIDCQESAELG